eukprot:13041978-Alexandrium_andersonii.AAC.1
MGLDLARGEGFLGLERPLAHAWPQSGRPGQAHGPVPWQHQTMTSPGGVRSHDIDPGLGVDAGGGHPAWRWLSEGAGGPRDA